MSTKQQVETLIAKASAANDSGDAMRFSQAALNAANAACSVAAISDGPTSVMTIEGRNIDEAAKCVEEMGDEELLLRAKHDPDLFRHIALGYRASKLSPPSDGEIQRMAERFLNWRLPDNFNPDCGIGFDKSRIHLQSWPTGTNLIGYTEALAMVRHMVAA